MARPCSDVEYRLLGLDIEQERAFRSLSDGTLRVFRVAVEAQAQVALLAPEDDAVPGVQPPRWSELSGNLREAQKGNPLARPCVGDFVAAQPLAGGAWRIVQVLPRRTQFVRQSKRKGLPQVIAANVDDVWVVTSPNEEFSPRRLERYLTAIHASGAEPGVILNKVDLTSDPAPWLKRVAEVALDAPVVATSVVSGTGLADFEPHLREGRTLALVGSSGVGKSSLTNALLGADVQKVAEIRASDDRGRHTTTHRELIRLPEGASGRSRGLLVDTPGMRAFALWAAPEALLEAFSDVLGRASGCRFRDCRHEVEPDCAVRAAVEAGQLSEGRVASFCRLHAEATARKPRTRRNRLRS